MWQFSDILADAVEHGAEPLPHHPKKQLQQHQQLQQQQQADTKAQGFGLQQQQQQQPEPETQGHSLQQQQVQVQQVASQSAQHVREPCATQDSSRQQQECHSSEESSGQRQQETQQQQQRSSRMEKQGGHLHQHQQEQEGSSSQKLTAEQKQEEQQQQQGRQQSSSGISHQGRILIQHQQEQQYQGPRLQAILGDLNTMANGIARCSPKYCCDAMRWKTLGSSEAAFWQRHVFAHISPTVVPQAVLPDHEVQSSSSSSTTGTLLGGAVKPLATAAAGAAGAEAAETTGGGTSADPASEDFASCSSGSSSTSPARPINEALHKYGLPREVCERLLNPGFYDPFDVDVDVTLDNPAYRVCGLSLMKGKLDWVLLKGFRVLSKEMGNHDYEASDHKWLMVEVLPAV